MCDERATFIDKSKCIGQYLRSGHVFYCTGKLPIKPSKNQCVINMWHGTPLKTIGKLSNIDNGEEFFFTYLCASSEFIKPIMAKAFGCPEDNVFINGEPKSDLLFLEKKERKNKLIVWTPTFRQSSLLGYNNSSDTDLLPLFADSEWEILNDKLKELSLDVVVKLHAGQDLHGFKYKEYSNLKVYSHSKFIDDGLELWSYLSQSDALITDYSSVYLMPGEFVQTKEELFTFFENVAEGKDKYKTDREKVNNIINKYHDGKSRERLLKKSNIGF